MRTASRALSPCVLALCLVGCAARLKPVTPSRDDAPSVLVIQKSASGLVTYVWRPLGEFDLSRLCSPSGARDPSRRIVLAAARPRDCHEEFNGCIDQCMDRPLSEDYAHIEDSQGAKRKFCRNKCWQPYLDCEELQERRPQEFSAMNDAVEWLSRHRSEVLAGSVVVIAGVAFVVAFPPGALLVLVPMVAMS